MNKLFDNALFEILSQVRLDVLLSALDGNLLHIVVDHDLDELLKRGLGRVPAQLALCFGRVAPEVDDVRRAVEVGG